jgi:translation elongation factor EF-Tu-like GTPase
MNEAEQDDRDKSFLMVIEDVFTLEHRHVIAIIGQVQQGTARKGDAVVIGYIGQPLIETTIAGFEGFIKNPDRFVALPSDNIAILLRDIQPDQIEPGMVIAAPGSLATS